MPQKGTSGSLKHMSCSRYQRPGFETVAKAVAADLPTLIKVNVLYLRAARAQCPKARYSAMFNGPEHFTRLS
jgi:hypothetical protein